MESFSGYAFCKAHSASYAAESMQSLYLKAHYPLIFMTAVINNFGGFYPTEFYVHEARKLGAMIEAPCLLHSFYCARLLGKQLFLGFIHIKGLRIQTVKQILKYRRSRKKFILDTLIGKLQISFQQWDLLIRSGAMRNIVSSHSEVYRHLMTVDTVSASQVGQIDLFETEPSKKPIWRLTEPTHRERVSDQIAIFGFPLCSPFNLLRDEMLSKVTMKTLTKKEGEKIWIYGYYVLQKPVTTIHGGHMCFATWLDVEGTYFDTVHFPRVLVLYPLRGRGVYRIDGKVIMEHGYPLVEVSAMWLISPLCGSK